ncbi:MAG: hypothetical protein RRA15_10675 [bacterium]|nr:hypothetical protein [bacterium]
MIDPGDQKGGISMGREDKIRQVAKLLGQTDSAHHSYEIKVLNGDRDSHWPEWFAEDLIGHGFDMVLEDRLATELLESFLRESRAEYRACDTDICWEEFAARRIVEKLV